MPFEDDISKLVEDFHPEEPEPAMVAVIRTPYGPFAVIPYRLVNGIAFIDMAMPASAIVTDENLAFTVAQTVARNGPIGNV